MDEGEDDMEEVVVEETEEPVVEEVVEEPVVEEVPVEENPTTDEVSEAAEEIDFYAFIRNLFNIPQVFADEVVGS